MLRFGPAGIPASSRTHEEGLERISALGLGALEIEFVRGVRMGYEEAARIGALARKLDIRLSAHAPYYVNLNSKDADIVEKSKKRIVDTMRMAAALGARTVVVHAGYYSEMDPASATRVMTGRVRECRRAADAAGCEDVVLGLETMGRRGSWGTLDEIGEVAGNVERVFPVLDFSHVHARSSGCLKSSGDFRDIIEQALRTHPPFLHCHFSGIEFGPSGERRHLDVRSASPDFSILAPVLLEQDMDITIICESPLLEVDAVFMKETVEKAHAGAGGREVGSRDGSRQTAVGTTLLRSS